MIPSHFCQGSSGDSDENDDGICVLHQCNEPDSLLAAVVLWIDCDKCGNYCACGNICFW